MTRLVGIGLLASAFAPLVALVVVLRLRALGWFGWVLLAACAGCLALLALVLHKVSRIQLRTVETASVRHADERVLTFTSSYVVPVVVALFGAAGTSSVLATSALVVLLAVIYVRASLYHLNPVMAVLGFRLYEVTSVNGTITMLLARRNFLAQRGVIRCRYLGDDVAIQLRGDDEH